MGERASTAVLRGAGISKVNLRNALAQADHMEKLASKISVEASVPRVKPEQRKEKAANLKPSIHSTEKVYDLLQQLRALS
jgi:hypothetical protein